MGKRGPAPTPTRVLQMRGTYRADRHGGAEPSGVPLTKVPTPPTYLSDLGKKLWRKKAKYLVEIGVLTAGDLDSLESYVLVHERAIEAEAVVAKQGRTVLGPQGEKRHPELVTAERARADMRRYEQEFGLTPSARTRVRGAAAPAATPKQSAFSQFAHARPRAGSEGSA